MLRQSASVRILSPPPHPCEGLSCQRVERGGRSEDEDCWELDKIGDEEVDWPVKRSSMRMEESENGAVEEKTRTMVDMRATCR
jgi:hypothetical protein